MIVQRFICVLIISITLTSCTENKSDPYAAYNEGEFNKAKYLLKIDADLGDLQAMTYLAAIYQYDREYNSAIILYEKAALQGFAPAQYNLAILLHHGVGVDKDVEQAYGWFHEAAVNGHSKASNQLALMVSELTPNQTIQAKKYIQLKLRQNSNPP